MKVTETYIIKRYKLSQIKWLLDFVLIREHRILPLNEFHIVKIYKSDKDEWYVETPGFEFGNTTIVYPNLRKIPSEIVNVKDLE